MEGIVQKIIALLSNEGGDKGVPTSKTKGVLGGKKIDFSKFFKVKSLSSAEGSRYKSIFEILGQTLQIGKYAKPEAASLKGTVAAPIDKKVNDSEKGKDGDDEGVRGA